MEDNDTLSGKIQYFKRCETKRSNLGSFLEIFAIIFYRLKSFYETVRLFFPNYDFD